MCCIHWKIYMLMLLQSLSGCGECDRLAANEPGSALAGTHKSRCVTALQPMSLVQLLLAPTRVAV